MGQLLHDFLHGLAFDDLPDEVVAQHAHDVTFTRRTIPAAGRGTL